MKIYIKKTVAILALFMVITGCNDVDQFSFDAPELLDTAQLNITITEAAISQCNADITITSALNATVYYQLLSSDIEAPESADVFSNGTAIELMASEAQMITTQELSEGVTYTFYAVTINDDGTRSEEVFKMSYNQPEYVTTVDTSYSGVSDVLGTTIPFTATLTAGATPNSYVIDTAWGPNLVAALTGDATLEGAFVYSGTLIINDDDSVEVIGDDAWATGGTGFYNACSNEIFYTLTQDLFTNNFTVNVVLTPDNL